MFFLAFCAVFYLVIGLCITITIADMNHQKWPSLGEWVLGLFWLPAILALTGAHFHYKWKYKSHK